MGLGMGINCVRCKENQLKYGDMSDEEKKLCGRCVVELNKQEYDRFNR